MKKLLYTLLLSAFIMPMVQAQSEMDLMRKIFKMEKKAALKELLELTEAQGAEFWTMYQEYEVERKAMGDARIKLIEEYATNYTSLTPEKADELVKTATKLRKRRDKLKNKYYKKARKIIGPVKAASFYQFENYVDNALSVEISNNIPFIGEL